MACLRANIEQIYNLSTFYTARHTDISVFGCKKFCMPVYRNFRRHINSITKTPKAILLLSCRYVRPKQNQKVRPNIKRQRQTKQRGEMCVCVCVGGESGWEWTNAQDGEMEKRMAGASDICDIINLLYNTQNFMNVRQL